MVSQKSIEEQLKRIGFNKFGWGRGEINELHNIILPSEEIYECVNGTYEGGFALLVASDVRVLLIDKKPLNYLTVEDMRFDMITEIDYSHRLLGANINISAGDKHLKFRSYNQPRLRKLINHVQHSMAEAKKTQSSHFEGQSQHLERINQQLQAYLMAQYEQQQKMHEQLQKAQSGQVQPALLPPPPDPIQPSRELADYLFAQSLLKQHQLQTGQPPATQTDLPIIPTSVPSVSSTSNDQMVGDIYAEGMQEVFGKKHEQTTATTNPIAETTTSGSAQTKAGLYHPAEINPTSIAFSKLPLALRNRKLSRPSFHVRTSRSQPQPGAEPLI